jgi:hypothetical protein
VPHRPVRLTTGVTLVVTYRELYQIDLSGSIRGVPVEGLPPAEESPRWERVSGTSALRLAYTTAARTRLLAPVDPAAAVALPDAEQPSSPWREDDE